ncbi:hypothetical protein R1CP_39560 (plasmid) [Rhodococcus opacus]|uniref:Uncharacterized protein n=1 Tax=Rhodococcus opacus TaxID=37919 RepID=A0A1B1KIQ8_RHOOP|nr:hypothetical protein R1CP_39560 [Rhodococcus opacus]
MTTPFPIADSSRSLFAGTDVCRQAGLTLPEGTRRPMFDDDRWDFAEVVGLPIQMDMSSRRFDFTTITSSRWRLVAKEQAMAMLAPHHEAVRQLPRAYRTPLHLRSVFKRLSELTRLFNWLTDHGIRSLEELDGDLCERYLHHRRYLLDDNDGCGRARPHNSPGSRPGGRGSGQSPEPVHCRPCSSGPAALGRCHPVGRRGNVRRPRSQQNPAAGGHGSAATPGRRQLPDDHSRSACRRTRRPPSSNRAGGADAAAPGRRRPRIARTRATHHRDSRPARSVRSATAAAAGSRGGTPRRPGLGPARPSADEAAAATPIAWWCGCGVAMYSTSTSGSAIMSRYEP